MTKEADGYSVGAGRSAVWCTWAHRASSSSSHTVGMLLNARVSPFLHFLAKSVTGSGSPFPALPIFACFFSLLSSAK